jgi:hypothetical protein
MLTSFTGMAPEISRCPGAHPRLTLHLGSASACPGEVESGFADKDMRQHKDLRRFPFIWDHRVIPYERETP